MNKAVYALALFILFVTVTSSIVMNFIGKPTSKALQNKTTDLTKLVKNVDWVSVLSATPNYQNKTVSEEEVQAVKEPNIQITDSQLVAIVVDEPTSILIFPQGHNNPVPLQLSTGDSWLHGWFITHINADSVTWQQKDSANTYVQYLFDTEQQN